MNIFSQWTQGQAGRLIGWTIYGPTTSDFPGFYVARAWLVGKGPIEWPWVWPGVRVVDLKGRVAHAVVGCLCPTLAEARKCIGPEFNYVARDLSDEPAIIESWI